jgi:hypothetical protein
MTKLLAISGRAQSGKSTMGNFLTGYEMKRHDVIEKFLISDRGELVVNSTFLGEDGKEIEAMGVLDLNQNTEQFYEYASRRIWPLVRTYAFADSLKEMCVNLFEIPRECIYGTNEQKNQLQEHLRWENMPGVVTPGKFGELMHSVRTPMNDCSPTWTMLLDPAGPRNGFWRSALDDILKVHEEGPMTAREFMQFLGTDVMRKIYGPIWINACLNRIKDDSPEIAVITDCRFVNEIVKVKEEGGYVIRMLRNPLNSSHSSEVDADGYTGYSAVINNVDMSIEESTKAFLNALIALGITVRI